MEGITNCVFVAEVAHLPYFEKITLAYEITLLSLCVCVCVFVCLRVCVSLPVNFWTPEPIFMKLGMYITATEPISTA
jgi:hypothetical protein